MPQTQLLESAPCSRQADRPLDDWLPNRWTWCPAQQVFDSDNRKEVRHAKFRELPKRFPSRRRSIMAKMRRQRATPFFCLGIRQLFHNALYPWWKDYIQDALAVVGDLTRPKTYSICTVHQDTFCDVATAMPRLLCRQPQRCYAGR